MTGSIFKDANQASDAQAKIASKSTAAPFAEDIVDSQFLYFRHKGIKVKFEDIEKVLDNCDQVRRSAVVFSENKEGDRRLVAYIIPNGVFNQLDITNELMGNVKPYMIPVTWICVESFSLKPSGEINKSALSETGNQDIAATTFLAPRNEMERTLSGIIQNLLNLPSISIDDNFFRLGGGSLQALRVIAAIRKELHLNIDIKYFFVYPTIVELAQYLLHVSDKHAGKQQNFTSADAFSKQKMTFLHTQAIIPIKKGTSKMPLYIVCGGGGTAFTFEKFAHMLDADQPVYGFQQPSDASALEQFPTTIEGIADKYLEELLLSDPDGPYALSGHCIGGVIALEMARKLQAMGKQVKLLAMFDVILEDHHLPEKKSVKAIHQIPLFFKKAAAKISLKLHFETFLITKFPKDAVEYKVNSLKSMANKIVRFQKEDEELVVFKKFEQKFETAFENYRIRKYDGEILVFYARDHYQFVDKNRNIRFKRFSLEEAIKNRWKNYADDVSIYEIEGGHSTMFEPFYSNDFAGVLRQHLKDFSH